MQSWMNFNTHVRFPKLFSKLGDSLGFSPPNGCSCSSCRFSLSSVGWSFVTANLVALIWKRSQRLSLSEECEKKSLAIVVGENYEITFIFEMRARPPFAFINQIQFMVSILIDEVTASELIRVLAYRLLHVSPSENLWTEKHASVKQIIRPTEAENLSRC